MRLKKTPELIDALHPLFDAADSIARAARAHMQSHNPMDKDTFHRAVLLFDHRADAIYARFELHAVETLINKLRYAALNLDQQTIDVLADAWSVRNHHYIDGLIDIDREITETEHKLTDLRDERARMAKDAAKVGISKYRIAEALGRQQSSVASWIKYVD